MIAPRKRFTTQTSGSRPLPTPLAPKHPKSIANPNQPCASQLIENKSTSQKSIANFRALPPRTFELPSAKNHRQINRHTFLLEIPVTHTKQRTAQILIATRNAFFPHAISGSANPMISGFAGVLQRPGGFAPRPVTAAVDLPACLPYACSLTTPQIVLISMRAPQPGQRKENHLAWRI
jgi:hypothetical protein